MVLAVLDTWSLASIGVMMAVELSATMAPIISAYVCGMPSTRWAIKAIIAVISTKHTVVSSRPWPTAPRRDKILKSIPLLNSTTISASVVKICPASPNDSGLTI